MGNVLPTQRRSHITKSQNEPWYRTLFQLKCEMRNQTRRKIQSIRSENTLTEQLDHVRDVGKRDRLSALLLYASDERESNLEISPVH